MKAILNVYREGTLSSSYIGLGKIELQEKPSVGESIVYITKDSLLVILNVKHCRHFYIENENDVKNSLDTYYPFQIYAEVSNEDYMIFLKEKNEKSKT